MSALSFRADGSFHVLQFTDLHFGHSVDEDQCIAELFQKHVRKQQPDLIVITGDLISGYDYKGADLSAYDEGAKPGYLTTTKNSIDVWRAFCDVVESTGCPWTFVFGNHDDDGNTTKEELFSIAASYPSCLAQHQGNEPERVGDHVLAVDEARLVFVDSGRESTVSGTGRWPWVQLGQVQWFRERMTEKQAGAPVLVFQHIPLPECHVVEEYAGQMQEAICAPQINSGFFAALLEAQDVKAVFFGHDHINDGLGAYCGIELVYGCSFGFGEYCLPESRTDVRSIVLQADGQLTTDLVSF